LGIYNAARDEFRTRSSKPPESGKIMHSIVCGLLTAATLAAAALPPQDTANDWNNRGISAAARGDFAEAEKLLDQAIQSWRTLGPTYDGNVAAALYNRGQARCGQGKWSAAVADFEEAVDRMSRFGGPTHLRTIQFRNTLANAYAILGEPLKSETLFKDSLAVERELYPNEYETARTLTVLSTLYARANRVGDALPLAEEALRIGLSARDEKDPETAILYSNLAQLLTMAGHTERSLPLFRKALATCEAALVPSPSQIASILSEEGLALFRDGKRALAEKDFVDAIERLSQCSACGLELAVAETRFALLRLDQHRFDQADTLLGKALTMEEEFPGRPGSEMAATLEVLSRVRQEEKRFDDARLLHSRAQTILTYR